MAFMHRVDSKSMWSLIIVSTILLGTTLINRNKEKSDEPSPEIQKLDAMLLKDLQKQEITIDDEAARKMECAGVNESELRTLFSIENVNYEKCDQGNCHYNSYTIESETKGKKLSFVLTSGDDGNYLGEMTVEGCE